MSWAREPLSSFVERVRHVSLTNRAGFYNNERVSKAASSSSDRAKPRGYRVGCRTDWFIYIPTPIYTNMSLLMDKWQFAYLYKDITFSNSEQCKHPCTLKLNAFKPCNQSIEIYICSCPLRLICIPIRLA
jgi:hypothetical protein